MSETDLSPSMAITLDTLCAATSPDRTERRWAHIDGLNVHKSSIYALQRRDLAVWNPFRQSAKVTPQGWVTWRELTEATR